MLKAFLSDLVNAPMCDQRALLVYEVNKLVFASFYLQTFSFFCKFPINVCVLFDERYKIINGF